MPRLLHLRLQDQAVICALIPMPDLLTIRACSHAALEMVTELLRHKLFALCASFVPQPRLFLEALMNMRGYIGGEAAVAFMLRDVRMTVNVLHIFIPSEQFGRMLHELVHTQGGELRAVLQAEDDYSAWLEDHAVDSLTFVRTPPGDIQVFESSSIDALAAVACRPTSLDVTYVNPVHFGTAYPALTFAKRGLVADWQDGEAEHVQDWLDRGIDMGLSARRWPEYAGMTCAAAAFVCPTQPRRFLDAGAMYCRMHPLKHRALRTVVMWRLDFRPCGGGCLDDAAGNGMLGGNDKYAAL